MPETPKNRKVLKKSAKGTKLAVADDLVCIPRELYLQMLAALKGQANNGGRAKSLLAELPKVEN